MHSTLDFSLVLGTKLSLLWKVMPRYLCSSTLFTSFPLMNTCTGASPSPIKKSTTISFVFLAFSTRNFIYTPSLNTLLHFYKKKSVSLVIRAVWLVSLANVIIWHEAYPCLQSAVYRVKTKGDNTKQFPEQHQC